MGVMPESDESRAEKRRTERHTEVLTRSTLRGGFASVAEQVAGSSSFYRNHIFAALREHFKAKGSFDQRLWTVSRYFPFADGGALAVEEPRSEADRVNSVAKIAVLRGVGIRCVLIEHGATYDEAMQGMIESGAA